MDLEKIEKIYNQLFAIYEENPEYFILNLIRIDYGITEISEENINLFSELFKEIRDEVKVHFISESLYKEVSSEENKINLRRTFKEKLDYLKPLNK